MSIQEVIKQQINEKHYCSLYERNSSISTMWIFFQSGKFIESVWRTEFF